MFWPERLENRVKQCLLEGPSLGQLVLTGWGDFISFRASPTDGGPAMNLPGMQCLILSVHQLYTTPIIAVLKREKN